MKTLALCLVAGMSAGAANGAPAFEGHLTARLTRGGETQSWVYTISSNRMRVERAETNWPHARNLLALDTGELTLLFPHNRSFVRLKGGERSMAAPGFPAMPPLGMGIGTPQPPAQNLPGPGPGRMPEMPPVPPRPEMPALPPVVPASAGIPAAMPAPPLGPLLDKFELKAIGARTNLLGFACEKYELKHHLETMEIWATTNLPAFQPWLANQPPRFALPAMEDEWGQLLKARHLFPLLAVMRFENGPERLRYEVTSVKAGPIQERALFQPPSEYRELSPLPF